MKKKAKQQQDTTGSNQKLRALVIRHQVELNRC